MFDFIIVFIVNLFSKRKVYKKYVHICHSYNSEHVVKSKLVSNGKIGKGKLCVRYNVYERGICIECVKPFNYKVATNIPASRVYTKFNIKI